MKHNKISLSSIAQFATVGILALGLVAASPAQQKPTAKKPLTTTAKKAVPAKKAPAKKAVPAKKAPAKAVAAVPKAPAFVLPPASKPMLGTWVVVKEGKEDPNMNIAFRPDGTFSFIGTNYKSTGHFRINDGVLFLNWASIDGTRVNPEAVKGRYVMADSLDAFTIDRFTYMKAGSTKIAAQ
jgi:hypothetical protein